MQGVDEEVARASDSTVRLDADLCEVDVEAFKRDSVAPGGSANTLDTLARAAYATGLYRGDLLEDWDLEWCRLEREQLRQRFVYTLRALAEGFERLGRYDLALQYARRAVDAEPSDEPAQRTFIRLLMRTGDRGSAARQFHKFAEYVRSELGIEPDSQTVALFGQAKGLSSHHWPDQVGESRVPPIRPGMIPLVGRIEEREQVSGLLDAAMSGNGGSVLVVGEAGIGKSKLVEWAMEEWAARGGLTARGRCIEFNDPIPYQPVLDAIGSVADTTGVTGFATQHTGLPSPFEEVGIGTEADRGKADSPWPAGKLRLFGWLLARLERVSRRRPLLAAIEDLQWADASSVDFLAYLLERARNMHLVVLVTARSAGGAVGHALHVERLTRYCTRTLRLHPLTALETAELIRFLLDRPRVDSGVVRHIYGETEGNPLFVVETIRLLQQQGRIAQSEAAPLKLLDDMVKQSISSKIPDGVRAAVEQRLQLIDPPALRIARIASVLGRSFDEELLSMLAGAGANRLSRTIGRLLRAGIFEREDAGYRFAHDKIRAVCYEGLPVRVRRVYHAKAAAALSQIPGLPIHRLAWQQDSAEQWNLAAASWDQAGDDAVTVHAYEEALRAYEHAIACVQRDTQVATGMTIDKEIRLLFQCDRVLTVLGRPSDRCRILDRIDVLCRTTSDTTLRANLFVRRALLEDYIGNSSLAARLARKAWGIACTVGDQHTEIEALHVVAYALSRVERFRRALAILRLALRRIGDQTSPSAVTGLMHLAVIYSVFGDFVSASATIETARKISDELGLRSNYHQILSRQAVVDKFAGNVRQSRLRFSEALRFAREANDPVLAARVTLQIAFVDALEGRLGDAISRLREGMVACRAVGYMRAQVFGLNEVAYSVGRLLGNYSWAWDASARALRLPVTIESDYLSWMCKDSQAAVLLDQGRLQEAMILINECLGLVASMRTTIGPSHAFLESLARRGMIWLHLGNPNKAAADLEEAKQTQARLGHRVLLVDTLTYLALAYGALGDAERGLSTSSDSLNLLAEIGYANHQPQRIFWHHYLILEKFHREPRLPYLKRAVEFIEAQAATLSKAQARRLRRDVRLNREILEAWEQHKHEFQSEARIEATTPSALAPVTPVSASPAI